MYEIVFMVLHGLTMQYCGAPRVRAAYSVAMKDVPGFEMTKLWPPTIAVETVGSRACPAMGGGSILAFYTATVCH
jgi:hypothetical protein